MKKHWIAGILCACLASSATASEKTQEKKETPRVSAPITKLALFKNGVGAVVREAVPLSEPFFIKDEMTPIHGTLWLTPYTGFRMKTVKHPVPEPNEQPFRNLTATYENREVRISLLNGSGTVTELAGKVIRPVPPKKRNRISQPLQNPSVYIPVPERFLTLSLSNGEIISIDSSRILSIRAQKLNQTLEQEKETLLIMPETKLAGPLSIAYLTNGAAWAPSYHLELGADAKMRLSMSCVIINELEDLKDVEVNLISGYPNIQFEKASSPMAPGMTLARFFAQLSGQGDAQYNPIAKQGAAVMFNMAYAAASKDSAARGRATLAPSGESEDIHYRNIGRISLNSGERLYLPLESAESTYERIVEWAIDDRRDDWGRPLRFDNAERYNGTLWDAVRFRNPFRSPITTAPIEITDGGKFLGQTTINWVNPDQSNILRITRAMTVIGEIRENELSGGKSAGTTSSIKQNPGATVRIAGNSYRKQEIEGVLTLRNYRKSDARVMIKMRLSGELLSADGNPSRELVRYGYTTVNPRSDLKWETLVKADGETKIRYRYSVLVRY